MGRLAGRNKAARTVVNTPGTMTTTANAAPTAVANAVASVGVPTKAEFDAVVALANDLKVKYNAAVTLINELKGDSNAVVTGLKG